MEVRKCTQTLVPHMMAWAAMLIAFKPDEHTLLMVVASVLSGKPGNKKMFFFSNFMNSYLKN